MNIQEKPLRNAINAAYTRISARKASTMHTREAIAIVESIQLAVIPVERVAPPVLVPTQYWSELEKLSKAALMDIAWDYATRAHGVEDDLPGIMIELRATADVVLEARERCK